MKAYLKQLGNEFVKKTWKKYGSKKMHNERKKRNMLVMALIVSCFVAKFYKFIQLNVCVKYSFRINFTFFYFVFNNWIK